MNIYKMRRYSGQAIAIIMIILVVATVIGASLYSRVLRNREGIVETRESARALEQADTLLDVFINSDLYALQPALDVLLTSESPLRFDSVAEIRENTSLAGIVDTSVLAGVSDWCEDDQDSQVNAVVSYATVEDSVPYSVGDVKTITLDGVAISFPCAWDLAFASSSASSNDELFVIKKVYMNSNNEVKPYEEDDMLLYCMSTTGSCTNDNLATDATAIHYPDAEGKLSINLVDSEVGYPLYEVRVIVLDGELEIASEISGGGTCISPMINDYKINAQVTCNDDYREKQVVIPNVHNLGYPSLFDYTIYNDVGVLRPS